MESALARPGASTAPALPVDPYGRVLFRGRAAIQDLAEEVASLRGGYRARRAAELARERKVRARTAELIERAVAPLLASDQALVILDCLLDFLEGVLAGGSSELVVDGD